MISFYSHQFFVIMNRSSIIMEPVETSDNFHSVIDIRL